MNNNQVRAGWVTTGLFLGMAVAGSLLPISTSAAVSAKLWLDPAARSVAVGDVFTVSVMLDTAGNAIDGVDLHYLRYNKTYLEVQDADMAAAGVQIAPGTLMPMTARNVVDTAAGTIDFSQITTGGSTYTGSGVLAKVTFKVVGSDTPEVSFDFTAGKTTDTNVASQGVDVLMSATGARFVNTGGIGAPPPPPSGGVPGSGSGGSDNGPVVSIPPMPPMPTNPTTPGSGPSCMVPNFTAVLKVGSRDSQVKMLQRFLNARGYVIATSGDGSAGSETDYFGLKTKAAVARFQEAYAAEILTPNGLTVGSGFFGAATRAKLQALIVSSSYVDCAATPGTGGSYTRNLALGARGEDVRLLQMFLIAKAYLAAGNDSGYFGPLTKAALIKFQEAYAAEILTPNGLTVGSGFFGAATRAKVQAMQ